MVVMQSLLRILRVDSKVLKEHGRVVKIQKAWRGFYSRKTFSHIKCRTHIRSKIIAFLRGWRLRKVLQT